MKLNLFTITYHTILSGSTYPDPKETSKLDDTCIPVGKLVEDKKMKSDLLYNEYIVYNVAQVNIKYLLVLKFNYQT